LCSVTAVLYLRDVDPAIFLETPLLAPFAVLGRGSPQLRAEAFAACLRLIGEQGGTRTSELLEFAATLAVIRLKAPTIEQIIKEVAVTITSVAEFYRDTEFGRKLRHEGREEGRHEMLTDLLRERFGEHPGIPDAARRLAGWPSPTALHAIIVAESFEALPATHSA